MKMVDSKFRTYKRKYFTQQVIKMWDLLPQDGEMATGMDCFKGGLDRSMEGDKLMATSPGD